MHEGTSPALAPLFGQTDEWARSGDIDDNPKYRPSAHLCFCRYNDAVINSKVGEAAYRFYRHYLPDQGNLFYQNTIGAGYSQVTVDYGLACADNKEDFIDKCNYDQAGIVLQHINGALDPKNDVELSGKLLPFDQRAFTFPESPGSYSMAETGYVYVPASCAARRPCRIHVVLHGCKQNFDTIGDRYSRHAGYNEWANTNQLVILYPQTVVGDPLLDFGTPLNPFGCWDWWGYTNFNYAVKAGRQITAIKAMLDRLTDAHAQNSTVSSANPAAPWAVVLNDVADSGAAVAWRSVAGATDYKVYRAFSGDPNFASLGSVSAPSFGDMSLRHATSYDYRVTATVNGGEGPASGGRHCNHASGSAKVRPTRKLSRSLADFCRLGNKPIEQHRGGRRLGSPFGGGGRGCRNMARHTCRYRKQSGVMGSVCPYELVNRERQAPPLRPFLQRRFRVARRTFHLSEQWLPEPVHKGRGRLEAAIEVYCGDQGLAGIGQNAGVGGRPYGRFGARQDEIVSEPNRVGDTRERFSADQMSMATGQMPLGLVLETPPQQLRDNQAEHPVAQEFKALVAARREPSARATATVLRRQRARMSHGLLEEFGPGKFVSDCPRQILRSQTRL